MTHPKSWTTITGQEASREVPVTRESRQVSDFPQGPEIVTCFHDLEVGQIIEATVKRVEDYGAFVDIDGIDDIVALLLVVDISWARVPHPSVLLSPGQRIKAKIRGISLNRSHASLSMKVLQPDPWLDIDTKYPLHSVAIGCVTSITDYGIFVELEYGIEGLIHYPETGLADRDEELGETISVAQKVKVQIMMIDPAKRRISLRMEAASR
ncbi:S1 RNA-binding domain-containing protein [Labrys sp. KB_33_2]|uniref:S1 RNA-binding domain-containing protein n=1 Tax=Labrys sp. KB_33_2 TaxID=3237479 RepID=UPI003F8E30D6